MINLSLETLVLLNGCALLSGIVTMLAVLIVMTRR